ncbi:hypothetical protein GCM10010193_20810 [Kitasatospora atroaurantiaca]
MQPGPGIGGAADVEAALEGQTAVVAGDAHVSSSALPVGAVGALPGAGALAPRHPGATPGLPLI